MSRGAGFPPLPRHVAREFELHERRPAGAEAVGADEHVLDAHALEILRQHAATAALRRRLGRRIRTSAALARRLGARVVGIAVLIAIAVGAVHRDDFGLLEQREFRLPGVALGGGAPPAMLESGDDLLELVDQVGLLTERALGRDESTAQLVDVRRGDRCVHGKRKLLQRRPSRQAPALSEVTPVCLCAVRTHAVEIVAVEQVVHLLDDRARPSCRPRRTSPASESAAPRASCRAANSR